jgi:putative heme iron utilization protein
MKVQPAAFLRTTLDGQPAVLNTRVVSYQELAGNLPADTTKVTDAERAAAMWERFRGISRRYVL